MKRLSHVGLLASLFKEPPRPFQCTSVSVAPSLAYTCCSQSVYCCCSPPSERETPRGDAPFSPQLRPHLTRDTGGLEEDPGWEWGSDSSRADGCFVPGAAVGAGTPERSPHVLCFRSKLWAGAVTQGGLCHHGLARTSTPAGEEGAHRTPVRQM